MGPLLYIFINRLEPLVKKVPENERYSMRNCYWFVYGALLKQGSALEPSSGEYLINVCVTIYVHVYLGIEGLSIWNYKPFGINVKTKI